MAIGAHEYTAGALIRATVANGLDRAVYSEDSKTGCAIAYLQRLDGGTWVDIVGCQLGRPPATVSIAPGLGRTVAFDPHSFHLTSGTGGPALRPGHYRVKFTYSLEPGTGDEPLTAYSAEFRIR